MTLPLLNMADELQLRGPNLLLPTTVHAPAPLVSRYRVV
jgi:hypothetical protein